MKQVLLCAHRWSDKIETSETKVIDGEVHINPMQIRICRSLCKEGWNTINPEPRIVLGYFDTP